MFPKQERRMKRGPLAFLFSITGLLIVAAVAFLFSEKIQALLAKLPGGIGEKVNEVVDKIKST